MSECNARSTRATRATIAPGRALELREATIGRLSPMRPTRLASVGYGHLSLALLRFRGTMWIDASDVQAYEARRFFPCLNACTMPDRRSERGRRQSTSTVWVTRGQGCGSSCGRSSASKSARFALCAHMQPGSLRVTRGDRVTRGQVIGLLGNFGNTD